MSQSWKWFFPALNEVEGWGQGALWEALGKIQPQSWSGCSWNSTALCWTLGPLSGLAGELKYFYLQEDLSEDLEPEEGHWVVQHSCLG